MLAGLWEFPGGKQEPGETLPQSLERELMEETGIRVAVGRELCVVRHAYSHFRITLHAFLCRHVSGRPRQLANAGVRWVPVGGLDAFPFPAADRRILIALADLPPQAPTLKEAPHARTDHSDR